MAQGQNTSKIRAIKNFNVPVKEFVFINSFPSDDTCSSLSNQHSFKFFTKCSTLRKSFIMDTWLILSRAFDGEIFRSPYIK